MEVKLTYSDPFPWRSMSVYDYDLPPMLQYVPDLEYVEIDLGDLQIGLSEEELEKFREDLKRIFA